MKRANGTGSIVNLGPNRRRKYAVKISYQEREGLWKQKYISYHATVKEAQAALDNYLSQNIQPGELATTFGMVYEAWSAKKYKKAGPASVTSYKASWIRLSVLAEKEMFRVSIDDLQRIIDQDEADGLSRSSISNDKMLMKALFKYALERDIVTKDCSAFVEIPQVAAKFERGAFSEEQMRRLNELVAEGFTWAGSHALLHRIPCVRISVPDAAVLSLPGGWRLPRRRHEDSGGERPDCPRPPKNQALLLRLDGKGRNGHYLPGGWTSSCPGMVQA